MDLDNWIIQLRKGVLELCILNVLNVREYYGYELVKKIISIPGLGVKEGTIYPLLSRLKNQDLLMTRLVESHEGPARKYYSLTEKGKELLAIMNKYFASLVEGIKSLINEGDENG